jgi:glycosyltransferase involved in cell wall biosynthesis
LRVGLNATCINDRPSGARQRFVGIYSALVRQFPDIEFVVYEPSDCRVAAMLGELQNVSARRTNLTSEGRALRFIRSLGYWRAELARERFDLVDWLTLPVVKNRADRIALTIHDIRRLHAEYGGLERAVYRRVLQHSLKTADRVVTVSEAMKKEILDFHPGISVAVVYNGLDPSWFEPIDSARLLDVRRKLELPDEFVLAVGHFEKRKNYLRLVDAVERLRARGSPCPLVIIGNDSGEKKAVEDRIASAGLRDHVKIFSGLGDVDVRCVYQLCSLFVFPSLYEGFGIPILEAMAARRPMALSDIPVFREITQDRSIYFAPDDVESMAASIELALHSEQERAHMVEFGVKRVGDFGFGSLAAQVERVYRSML